MGMVQRAVGVDRTALLVAAYCERLKAEDGLSEDCALKVAARAYAEDNVYVIAAPGQIWMAKSSVGEPSEIYVRGVEYSARNGIVAIFGPAGEIKEISLDKLMDFYRLESWGR